MEEHRAQEIAKLAGLAAEEAADSDTRKAREAYERAVRELFVKPSDPQHGVFISYGHSDKPEIDLSRSLKEWTHQHLFKLPALEQSGFSTQEENLEAREEERQKTREIELARELGSLKHHHEFLEARTVSLEERNKEQLGSISALEKSNRALQAVLISKLEKRVRILETHRGTVIACERDEVAVLYETDDSELEQVYHRDQFIDGKLPNVGDLVEAHVIVATQPDESDEDETATSEEPYDFSAFREKGIRGRIEI